MASLLLSGPAGGGKTGAARTALADSAAPAIVIDFQTIYAGLLGIQRLPSGRYPERLESDAYALALSEYTRRAMITGAVTQEVDAIVTNSDGNPRRREFLRGLLGPGATETVIDPGIDVVTARLSNAEGTLSEQCRSAIGRWYGRLGTL